MDPTEIQTKMRTITKTLTEETDRYKQDKQKLLKRKAELLADIMKFRQEINDELDKLEKTSVTEIEIKLKILDDKIEEGLKQLQANKDSVTATNNKFTSPNINQSDEFVLMMMGEQAVHDANKCIEDYTKNIKFEGIRFQPDRTLITKLEKSKSLGMLDSLPQIKGERSYCVKVKSDKVAGFIISACHLTDGSIILADNTNKKLKRIDSNNYTVRDFCGLPERPWQVCSINNSQVAVSLQSEGIHFISLDRQMTSTRKINTEFQCYGLAYANDNLYISDKSKSVYIYTLSGR